jgi:hypothetical protein
MAKSSRNSLLRKGRGIDPWDENPRTPKNTHQRSPRRVWTIQDGAILRLKISFLAKKNLGTFISFKMKQNLVIDLKQVTQLALDGRLCLVETLGRLLEILIKLNVPDRL